METIKAIFKRRSIRKYKDTPVTKEQINTVLQAAMVAPTARNTQDWEFLVITDKEGRQKIMQNHPYAQMLANAPAAIIVCNNKDREAPAEGYGAINGAAAIQNMLLCATDLGLGSVWLGVYPRPERITALKNAFNLPENINPIGIVVLGYADEERPPQDRFDPKKVHFEKW